MNGLKELCLNPECGHEKDSHFFDEHGPGDCLAMRCDCRRFHKAAPTKGPKRAGANGVDEVDAWGANKPHADTSCLCRDCSLWFARKRGAWGLT